MTQKKAPGRTGLAPTAETQKGRTYLPLVAPMHRRMILEHLAMARENIAVYAENLIRVDDVTESPNTKSRGA